MTSAYTSSPEDNLTVEDAELIWRFFYRSQALSMHTDDIYEVITAQPIRLDQWSRGLDYPSAKRYVLKTCGIKLQENIEYENESPSDLVGTGTEMSDKAHGITSMFLSIHRIPDIFPPLRF
ncbi:hypothetical protein CEXT_155121 [Caerostris extrusa]|uniref:Uncharacterized protein n=1 Tax=Caerostris extrusa TaxID=172846 RepID=A0AAV4MJY2_CAEEX|nr:hypothetical protein CEXT_155121 [Caerostris extrusa]